MEDLQVGLPCSASQPAMSISQLSSWSHRGVTGTEALQEGTSSSEPVPLGTLHVHMQTWPSV